MNLSLGFSPCPNDTFMFDALVNDKIEHNGISFGVRIEDVETLNEASMAGLLDVTKLSYAQYGKISDKYQLLDSGSALGHQCGPLLIARKQYEPAQIDKLRIGIPGKYTTAHFLFTNFYPGAQNKAFYIFSDIEKALLDGEIDAGVIIHENRFTYHKKGLVKISDLGDLWEETYQYPIPLGGIAIRRSLPEEIKRDVEIQICASIRFAFQYPESSNSYVASYAQEMDAEVMQSHINLYVNDYSVSLGSNGRAAVSFLLSRMEELKLSNPLTQPIFVN